MDKLKEKKQKTQIVVLGKATKLTLGAPGRYTEYWYKPSNYRSH